MPTLTKEQIWVLEDNDWTIVCESPFEMEFNSQFCGTATCKSVEEAIVLYNDIIQAKEVREAMVKARLELQEKREAERIKELKDSVKNILTIGITEDTLLEFFNIAMGFTRNAGQHTYSRGDIKKFVKEAFDEVDPG